MKRINAVTLRQSLSKVVAALQRTGEPIILEKGKKPVAAIISLRDFQQRFVEKAASEERRRLFEEMDGLAGRCADVAAPASADEILRELRRNG